MLYFFEIKNAAAAWQRAETRVENLFGEAANAASVEEFDRKIKYARLSFVRMVEHKVNLVKLEKQFQELSDQASQASKLKAVS